MVSVGRALGATVVAAVWALGCGRSGLDHEPQAAGASGSAGASGTAGMTGQAGASGTAGATGQAGASGTAGTGDEDAPATPRAFCTAFYGLYAKTYVRCFGGTLAEWNTADLQQTCVELDELDKTIRYDADLAKSCLASLEAALATDCSPMLDCVDKALAGLVPDGGACTQSAECGPASDCRRRDDAICSTRVCIPEARVGAPCNPGCAPGGVCQGGVCVTQSLGDVGDACDGRGRDCQSELVCRPSDVQPGIGFCTKVVVGDACGDDSGCEFDQFCEDGTCELRFPTGSLCADYPQGCAVIEVCDASTRRCVDLGHVGQPCLAGGECLSGLCDGTTCVPLRTDGQPCGVPSDCQSGVCQNNRCVACAL